MTNEGAIVETVVQAIITGAPNLALAVWFILQQRKTLDGLLDNQTKLIDRLLEYVETDRQTSVKGETD